MTDYLTLDDLVHVISHGLGQPPDRVVRDWGLLESALHRPQSTVFGTDAYPTLDAKAAALLHSLARNHPLVDGNKRLAWLAARLFYAMNGRDLRAPDPVTGDRVIREIAAGHHDVEALVDLLRPWVRDLPEDR